MNILAIDTSTNVMGVALYKQSELCGELVTDLPKNHSVRLMPSISYLMEEVEMKPNQLNKIVVAKGPGSYTGVRIGLSTAKSLAWSLDIPIVGVSSLEVLAYQGRDTSQYICPFYDARRKAIFTGLYKWENNQMIKVLPDQHVLLEDWLTKLNEMNKDVIFLSPDINMHRELIQDTLGVKGNIPLQPYHIPKPSDLALAGMSREPDHVHTLAPQYLRLAEAEANWLKKQEEAKFYD